MIYILCKKLYLSKNPIVHFCDVYLIDKVKCLCQSGSSNFCLKLRKNSLFISQSYFSNFALFTIKLSSDQNTMCSE